ncbi:MAG TPA: hypothetical protein VIQ31_18095, partial [Phormidium sp.]
MSKLKIIVGVIRDAGVDKLGEDNFTAYEESQPELTEEGGTMAVAIGRLLLKHKTELGIDIEI